MNSHLSAMSIQEETPPPPVVVEQEYRPLNVKDALTYFYKVKAKFSSQTNVYNQFLDIMKDFKSQT
jgi:paired amphipathic helix protein Sin3a